MWVCFWGQTIGVTCRLLFSSLEGPAGQEVPPEGAAEGRALAFQHGTWVEGCGGTVFGDGASQKKTPTPATVELNVPERKEPAVWPEEKPDFFEAGCVRGARVPSAKCCNRVLKSGGLSRHIRTTFPRSRNRRTCMHLSVKKRWCQDLERLNSTVVGVHLR